MGSGATFDSFAQATTFRQIVQSFNQLCLAHGIDPTDYDTLYAKLHGVDSGSDSSKAQTFFSLIDKRFNHPIYLNQKVAKQLDVLIVGAGPCGLRAAIECRLLGAHVVVIEQRDKFTRNNVLHLWPFVTEDLKSLGVKIFYPKFCTGCIDHISIRQLQCVLLKVALCVGVQVYDSVSFVDYQKPTIRPDGTVGGWTALLEPPNHILSEYEFDILIGADGKRNTVKGFAKDCMRAQLAIGITANFKNMRTAAEILVPELSGVAYLYRQSFFNRMEEEIGVQLENIVYYKDDTHYFVMSAKKKSLLKKKVLKQDYDEISLLLAKDNIDQEMLCKFATETANFATENKLPLNFVTNTRGDCDVAMFDFTCMYKAQHSTRLYEHGGKFLLTTIVGDSLYEPFWPTGSGCARGFLGVFDSAWMIRELGLRERPTIEIIADRERVYSLLGKASKDNMKKALSLYTIDPTTRYSCIELVARSEKVKCHVDFQNAEALGDNDIWDPRNGQPYGLESANRDKLRLWRFCDGVLAPAFTLHRRVINFSAQSWGDGFPLAFLMGRFRGDLVNLKEHCTERDADKMVKAVLEAIEREYGLAAPCEGIEEWEQLDDGERYQYIKSLVTHLKRDQEHVRKAFSSTPRIANRKRVRVNTSNTYKSEQIQRATEMLKSQFTDNDSSNAKAVEKSLEAQREIIERTVDISPDVETKHFTKKPFVERLDPVKLCRVEQIISGQLEKDQSEQFHNTRFVTSAAKTRRLDRTDLEEMEQKLEKTGMGVLIDKDKIHSMSSKEEKMMRMSAADARSFALGGFKDDCEKFKDIDSRLEKADKQLKNTALSGVTIVSQIRGVPSTKKGPPPPTPPKSVRPNVPEVPMRANAPENAPRPVSMPATSDSLYSSINSRRRNPCALCSNEVYLAEQLLVEKKVVHKRCFRCCYCEQPLRLGNHGTDRAITEAYGIRFFCSQHMAMSYRDKVARIEKHTKRANRASVAIVQPLPPVPASLTPKTAATNTISNAQSKTITETPNEKQPVFGLHSINSPDAYKQRTIERIQAIAEQPKISASLTPERAEFQCVRPSSSRRKQPARELNEAFLLTSDDEEVDDTKWTKFRSRGESSQSSEIESSFSSCTESDTEDVESVASDVEDHFTDCQEWLQDCLGDQLRDYFEEHPDEEVTMQNAEEVLNLYNKMIQGEALTEADCPNTPEGTEPLNGSIYYTTRSKFNSPKEESDEEKSSGSNGDLLDNTISGFGARFSLNHCPNDALSTSPSSRVYDTDAPATAEDTQTIDTTPTRSRANRPLREVIQRSLDMGTASVENGDRARAHSSAADNSAIPFADDTPEQRQSSGWLRSKLPALMRKGRSTSKGRPSSVTVVPVDPDVFDERRQQTEKSELGGQVEEERRVEKISTGPTTCISILPDNQMPCCPQHKTRVFTCSICVGLASSVSVPSMKTKIPLSATLKNIQRIKLEMEKYRSNVEHEKTLMAQELQRKISETESRLQDVIVTGSDLEYLLKTKTGTSWTLERWVEYLQEYKMLNLKLEDLHIRVKEMQLNNEYAEIQRQMASICTSSLGVMPVGMNEKRTRENSARLIALFDQRQAFHDQRITINKKWEDVRNNSDTTITEQGKDFQNFTPVFSELKLQMNSQNPC